MSWRDRDFDMRTDIPDQDRFMNSRGQSYRPNRSPRRDDRGPARSPPRRGPPFQNNPLPPPPARTFRDRSRSPREFVGRPRSPPFRRDNAPLNARPLSPPRGAYGISNNGPRGGSTWRPAPRDEPRDLPPRDFPPAQIPLKRSRDASPISSRGRNSPSYPKRGRFPSPPRGAGRVDARRSPPRRFSPPPRGRVSPLRSDARPFTREGERDPRQLDDRRRRSPSPRGPRPPPDDARGANITTRRSSPPVHPSRVAIGAGQIERPTPARSAQPSTQDSGVTRRESMIRTRSPSPRSRVTSDIARPLPVSRGLDQVRIESGRAQSTNYDRASRQDPVMPRERPYQRDAQLPPPREGVPGTHVTLPSGPRTSLSAPAGINDPSRARQQSSTSSTTQLRTFDSHSHPQSQSQHTQSQMHQQPPSQRPSIHLSTLPQPLPGGRKLTSLFDATKLKRLEAEEAKIREFLITKDVRKRQCLREWSRIQRECESAAYRSELADASLRVMAGDDLSSSAAF